MPGASKEGSVFAGAAKEGTIEDVNAGWGPREPQRWSYMTAPRTIFIGSIQSLDGELHQLQGDLRERAALRGQPLDTVPIVTIHGLREFWLSLLASWSGEYGRDTADYIQVVGAAKGQLMARLQKEAMP